MKGMTIASGVLGVLWFFPPAALAQDWPDLATPSRAVGGGGDDAALIVAVERYAYVPGVTGAKANGLAWEDYLTRTRKVPVDRVRTLYNEQASRERILREAAGVAALARPGGTLWFVFIGHGAPGHGGRDGVLVGQDTQPSPDSLKDRGVPLAEVGAVLQKSKAGRVVMVADACFSGRTGTGEYLAAGLQPLVVTTVSPTADPRFVLMTAARGNQFAGQVPGLPRPAFSYLVIGALRGWADEDRDGQVTAAEARDYALRVLKLLVRDREQEPDLLGDSGAILARSPGEAGPDLAALVRRVHEGGPSFQVTALPPVPVVTAPRSWDVGAAVMDFRQVDVEVMEQYDRVVRLDEAPAPRGSEIDRAKEKARAWRDLASRAPSLRDKALTRAAEWEKYADQQRALDEARRARRKARDDDWSRLSRLLPLRVIPEDRKREWASLFVQAYGTTLEDNPYCRSLHPYLSASLRCEGPEGFVYIPPGVFRMGSPDSEPGRDKNEGPVHEVTISRGFLLKATEVTQGEWRSLMGNNPSQFKNCGDTCPVENVNWWEAVAYCNALSRKEGLEECYLLDGCDGKRAGEGMGCGGVRFRGLDCPGYRLPTEAEWEYAARAGTETALYTGPLTLRGANDGPELDPIAWYGGNSGVDYQGGSDCSGRHETQYASSRCGTHPVGKKRPNAWGLYDMLGNVWEWVQDGYHDSYNGAPSDGSAWESPAGSNRVNRGGGWYNVASYARAANRGGDVPGDRFINMGFRPARSSP